MPNLLQIQDLRKKYNSLPQSAYRFDDRYIEFFSTRNLVINEGFSSTQFDFRQEFRVDLSFKPQNAAIVEYLENQKEAEVVLLFIDITNFSKKAMNMSSSELSAYLDKYYASVITILHKYQGVVEKIIGDGIICLFGQPFIDDTQVDIFEKADNASKEIIATLYNTPQAVKIAFHEGKIRYYKNKTENYPEYTMIGQPLTELFRLEGVSMNNAINHYTQDPKLKYWNKPYANSRYSSVASNSYEWHVNYEDVKDLNGVDFKRRREYQLKQKV